MIPAPCRRLGFLIWSLLFTPIGALAADSPLQFQSPDGRRTVSAAEARAPITLDGALDEEVWRTAEPATDFVQAEPHEGQAATERPTCASLSTATRSTSASSATTRRRPALIINDIRKDFTAGEQDSFEVILDTFADRRNGFVFVTNPAGAKSDTQIANEGRDVNTSWDAVWTVATTADATGWSAEMRIPFKTLRFERGDGSHLGREFQPPHPPQERGRLLVAGAARLQPVSRRPGRHARRAADASQGRNLRLKPWVGADSTRAVGGADVRHGVSTSAST